MDVPLDRERGKPRLHKRVRAEQQGHMESMEFKERRKRGTRVAHGEHGVDRQTGGDGRDCSVGVVRCWLERRTDVKAVVVAVVLLRL
jgi:PAS domain-containing protein